MRQVRGGPIDYLMMDYLAEVTMSIMQKQKSRDPKAGYARDFVPLMERILPDIVEKGIRVISNAGGVNPRGCAEAVLEVARRLGLAGKLKVGLVTGDDILGRLDELIAAGHPLSNMETGRPLADIRDQVLSANAYLGMGPIVEALRGGADVVVTGRVTDTGLTLGPIFHEFGWPTGGLGQGRRGHGGGPHHRVRRAVLRRQPAQGLALGEGAGQSGLPDRRGVAGRQLRGHQASRHRWRGLGRLGHASSWSTRWAIPRATSRPTASPTSPRIQLKQAGRDRVRVSGIRGGPRTPMLKVSVAYFYGYKAVGTLVYSWPEAYDKAQRGRPHPPRAARRTWVSSSSRSSPSSSARTPPTAR